MATAGAERTTGCVAPAASGESGRTGVLGAGVLTLPAPSSPASSPLLEAAPLPSADFASSPSAAGSASPSAGVASSPSAGGSASPSAASSPLATGAGGSSPSAGAGGSSPSAGAGGSDSSTTSASSGSSAGAGDSIGRKTSDVADASGFANFGLLRRAFSRRSGILRMAWAQRHVAFDPVDDFP